jgi:HPt (histidine-containing phosphotransfer) domain-containing protein
VHYCTADDGTFAENAPLTSSPSEPDELELALCDARDCFRGTSSAQCDAIQAAILALGAPGADAREIRGVVHRLVGPAGTIGFPTVGHKAAELEDLLRTPELHPAEALASYERRHLIAMRVPFIVPGNQLFPPELGIDLRECFRGRAPTADAHVSPATQAVLIAILLRVPWQATWQPATVVTELGYTSMTLSRVVKELVATGLARVRNEGRARWVRMAYSAADTWERARPLLSSPISRLVWVTASPTARRSGVRLAGLTALARVWMVADPPEPTCALSPAQWKAARQARVETLPSQMPGACEWQVWSYSPALAPNSNTVDPLSPILSLRDEADERVQKALNELRGTFPW